jgi:ceramide glucosyltransferase
MLPLARHDVLVIADSDVHCPPDYLDSVVRSLAAPGTGLSTTVYAGLAATPLLAGALGAGNINHSFLPGALMARWLGRQDCLGATMALRRETLDAIGGFAALVDHLADDHVLGKLVRAQGLGIRIADTLVATTVPEDTLPALFRHELRWNRTVLALVPLAFSLSAIQFPLFWAALAMLLSWGADWSLWLFLAAWLARSFSALWIDRSLRRCDAPGNSFLATPVSIWLLPLRDLMSMTTLLASYFGDRVEWRGQVMHTGRGGDDPVPPPAGPQSRQAQAS